MIEAKGLEDLGGVQTYVSAYIEKDPEWKDEEFRQYLGTFSSERIIFSTSPADGCEPLWSECLTFPSLFEKNTIILDVVRSTGKIIGQVKVPMAMMDLDTSVVSSTEEKSEVEELSSAEERFSSSKKNLSGKNSVLNPIVTESKISEEEEIESDGKFESDIEENIDLEKRSLGLHRWLPILDSKGNTKGHLHICVRALQACDLKDLTLSGTEFKESRNQLMTASAFYKDDLEFAKKYKVFNGTWNVGNAVPSEDLSEWIPSDGTHDILAIGCQECKYEPRSGFSTNKDDWINTLTDAVGPGYERLDYVQMWQIALAVFVKSNLIPEISEVTKGTEATGIGRVMGNKGGVKISFHVRHTSFCFINSHLAAHQDKVAERNADVMEIVNEIKSGCKNADLTNSFNYCFWMGDLNYRIEYGESAKEKKPSDEVFTEMVNMIAKTQYEELFEYDQLKNEMERRNIFANFHEGVYEFEPTFKVKKGETLVYDPKRSPSWCDRILWKNTNGSPVKQVWFENAKTVTSSDHKPVGSSFEIEAFYFKNACELKFDECSAFISDLRIDPLREKSLKNASIKFSSPILEGECISITPSLLDEGKTQQFPIRFTNIERLKQYFIVVEIFTPDAKIGYGQICLSKMIMKPTKYFQPFPFKCLITKGTQAQARLFGSLNFKWTIEARRRYSKLRYNL